MKRATSADGLAAVVMVSVACGGGSDGGSDSGTVGSADGPSVSQRPLVHRTMGAEALEPFLPESFAGHDRVAVRSTSQEWEGAVSIGAEGEYGIPQAGFAPQVIITIWDHGASEYHLRTYGVLAYATEERNGDEYSRHTTFRGHPTGERESKVGNRHHAGIEIFVADRFLVDVQGIGMRLDGLRVAIESLDIEGLAGLGGS